MYDLPECLFILVRTSSNLELFWGVNKLEYLYEGLKKIKKDKSNFIFRYAGLLKEVLKKKKLIEDWGYQVKDLHICYNLNLDIFNSTEKTSFIEHLKDEDKKSLLELERGLFNSFNITKEELDNWLKNDTHLILVYKENNELKGFIIIGVYGENKKKCFIRNIGVQNQARRKGVGKKLLLYGLRIAKEKGIKFCMLWVGIENKIARNLYEKVGFYLNEEEAEVVFQV